MNRSGWGRAAGSRSLRSLAAEFGALLRRISRGFVRGETGEARRANIVAASEDAIMSGTLGGVIVSWNPGAERMYGYTAEEAAGRTVWELVRPAGGSGVVAKNVARLSRGEKVFPFEMVHHHRSGERLRVSVSLAPVEDATGQLVGVSSTNRLVAKREEAGQELRESEERYRAVLEQSVEAIYLYDARTRRVLESNAAFQEMIGYDARELRGMEIHEFIAHDREDVDRRVRLTLAQRKLHAGERNYRRKDGTTIVVEISASVISSGGNETICAVVRDVTELKRAREALEASEERLRRQTRELTLLHRVRTVLAQELGLPDVFRAVVEAVARTYGYAQVSAYLLEDGELVLQHQVGYERVIERVPVTLGVMGRVARTGEPVLLEDVRSDASFLGAIGGITSEVCVPLFEGGRVSGTLNVESTNGVELAEDDLRLMGALAEHVGMAVSRSRLHARVRESEERFRSLVQNAPDVITLLGADGTILYESPSVERILGYAPEDLVGENAFDYLHPDDLGRVFGVFADVLLDPREVLSPVAYRFRRKDGSWCHLEATGSNQLDNPSVGAIVINSRDLTERKEAEDALRTSEARFQAVFENAAVGMALVDMEGRLTEGNPALQEMLGYGDEELRGMTWVELTHPDDVELDRSHFERLVAGELDRYRFEKRYVRKDGRVIWGQLTGSVIRGAEDEPRLMIGMVEDVTERKRAEEALRESHDLLQAVMEGTTDAIYVKDLRGRYLMANSACARVLGRTVEEVIGKDDAELFSPEDGREVMEDDRDIMATGKPRTSEDTKTAGNARRTYLITKGPYRDHEGKIAGVFGVSRDITERKRAEEALKESEERFRGAFEGAAVGVALVGLDMRYLRVNRALCEMLGYPEEELLRKTAPELIHPEDREISEERARRAKEEGLRSYDLERRYVRADGSVAWILTSVSLIRDSNGEPGHFVCLHQDISERKELEGRLAFRAFHDPLTGLPNRALFMDRLGHALARMSRRGLPVAVLYLDLDNFKAVNDSLGHEAGDRLLAAVAGRLKECVRPEDTLARLGGDEFAVLVEGAPGLEDAERVTRRILERLKTPFDIGGREVFASANVGVAPAAPGQEDPAKLLRNADLAMYGSKKRGRRGYKVFEAGEDDAVLAPPELGGDLRRALERGEFEIYYHPEISVETGRIGSMEALVRWRHPRRGLLEPGDFLPVAKEFGLIVAIEEWVLSQVCRQARAWQDRRAGRPALRVCVNVSETLFSRTDLAERVARALRETGLEPQKLSLEVAERVLADGSEATVAKLEALNELGVRVVIENFGTAYSALAVLRRFPLNSLKLDRSLVARLDEGPENAAIAEATVNLAHALGWAVTAQGVETAGQLARLRGMGADLAQGYLFSEPVAAEKATALLEEDLLRDGLVV